MKSRGQKNPTRAFWALLTLEQRDRYIAEWIEIAGGEDSPERRAVLSAYFVKEYGP